MGIRAKIEGTLVTDRADDLLHQIVTLCHSYDLPVSDDRPARIEINYEIGTIRLAPVAKGMSIEIGAGSAPNGFALREFVANQVEAFDPALMDGLCWAEKPVAGGPPPNFRSGRVVSVTDNGPLFQRLVIECPELSAFARDGLHLRLTLPKRGNVPIWPHVDDKGRTRWPSGEDALHVAVYTIRNVDPASGRMVIDAFRHGGAGATCAWLRDAAPGDAVGIMGPGGGWLPDARHLVLAGDETAFPAIFRILENAAPDTVGAVLLEAEETAQIPDFTAPPDMTVHRLSRQRNETLETALHATDLGPSGGRHVWFAAEKSRATAMRQHLRDRRNVAKEESYVAAYWSRE